LATSCLQRTGAQVLIDPSGIELVIA